MQTRILQKKQFLLISYYNLCLLLFIYMNLNVVLTFLCALTELPVCIIYSETQNMRNKAWYLLSPGVSSSIRQLPDQVNSICWYEGCTGNIQEAYAVSRPTPTDTWYRATHSIASLEAIARNKTAKFDEK